MTRTPKNDQGTPYGMHIQPLNGYIGAEISGVFLGNLNEAEFGAIREALVNYEVIVFRDQDITLDQQIDFAKRFGNLSVHPFAPNMESKPEVITFDYTADNPPVNTDCWHSDETFRKAPPLGTILRGKIIPNKGGDTIFASMTAAYQGLSERMKSYIHGMEAVHDFKPFRKLFSNSARDREKLREIEDQFPNPSHPLVAVHPESGRRILYVNPQFTVRLIGVEQEESDMILNYLYSQANVPEYQLRVKWRPNTVVMWDNRSTQHYAPHDYFPQRRALDRVTVAGTEIVGVTGPYAPATIADDRFVAPPAQPSANAKRPLRPFERQ